MSQSTITVANDESYEQHFNEYVVQTIAMMHDRRRILSDEQLADGLAEMRAAWLRGMEIISTLPFETIALCKKVYNTSQLSMVESADSFCRFDHGDGSVLGPHWLCELKALHDAYNLLVTQQEGCLVYPSLPEAKATRDALLDHYISQQGYNKVVTTIETEKPNFIVDVRHDEDSGQPLVDSIIIQCDRTTFSLSFINHMPPAIIQSL